MELLCETYVYFLYSDWKKKPVNVENRYYHMLPQCILINFPSVVSPVISIPPDIPLPIKAVLQHRFQLHI